MDARSYDLALELLDYQLVDADGRLAGNVDDIEIELPEGWPETAGEAPTVSGLLCGPGILAERFGGRVGHGWAELHRRLNPSDRPSTFVPIADVRSVDSAVHLGIGRDRLAAYRFERWFRYQIIEKIPGAKRAPE